MNPRAIPHAVGALVSSGRRLQRGVWLTIGCAAAGLGTSAQAQNLQTLYEAAKAFDATYLAARAQHDADQAKAQQAYAGVRPTVGLSAGANWTNIDANVNDLDRTRNGQSAAIAASLPLYRPANRSAVEQAEKSLLASQAQLQTAEQALIVRLADAYFNVLAAEDNLTFVKAQKAAVAEQLAAAKRNFEVGTSTVTDSREAQAQFDLVLAREIAAENDLRVKKLALDQLVGKTGTTPWRLAAGRPLPELQPNDVNAWVDRAEAGHPMVRQAQAGLEIAQLETRKAEASKGPTVDATAQYQMARGASTSPPLFAYGRSNTATVGVQLNWPLYTGGAVQNRIAETLALQDKARADLEAAKRGTTQATRAAYFGVVSGLGQVKALEAAEASSQSALEANQLGYQVGVRINIDVLNAQSQLFQTKASLAKARYDVLVGNLRLKQASGGLSADDLKPVDQLLAP